MTNVTEPLPAWSFTDSKILTRIVIDFRIKLELSREDDTERFVVSAEKLTLVDNAAVTHHLGATRPGDLGPLLGLLRAGITALLVEPSGTLRLKFLEGSTIEISPSPLYEAWEVTTPEGSHFISLPGGGWAEFPVSQAAIKIT